MEDENFFLCAIKRIIRNRWKRIEETTKYGWLTAYHQGTNISMNNSHILVNLSRKVVDSDNYAPIIRQIQELSQNLHPNDVPNVAEAVLNEIYMTTILKERRKAKKYVGNQVNTRSSTIFTIF